jgi:hypothetical protein
VNHAGAAGAELSRERSPAAGTWPPRKIAAWLAVGLSTAASSFWAYWGSIEAFYEGWYYADLLSNLVLTLAQYVGWMLVPMTAGLLGVWRPWAGASAHAALGIAALVFFGWDTAGARFLAMPLLALAVLYAFARPTPRRYAAACLVLVPLAIALVAGAYPAWRTLTRPAGADTSMRLIEGDGVSLVWAPAGPGWDDMGFPWSEAQRRCAHLDASGTTLLQEPQNIWRLPTVDEAVRSMIWRGQNAGGVWDAGATRATYRAQPDKESPLWNPYSRVIYWWTADEVDAERAYRINYQGRVSALPKATRRGYFACRCVKEP